MQIMLNGKPREVDSGTTIETLLNTLRLDCRQVVVERNQKIVAHPRQADTILSDGDTLEVVHFVGGG
jgi:thiamine biosynthesis protein ThiS